MAVSGADKAFRDRQAMIGEFFADPERIRLSLSPVEKNWFRQVILETFAVYLWRNAPINASQGTQAGMPWRDSLGDNAGMTRDERSTML
ncbi:MAG: hypothetical protein P4M06_01120 [Pandoraea sp.]|nr:hypothetical protein [Pandoraea sp.]MDR3396144.1 hypothetical protein [Pandoraea sp.]